MDFTKKNCLGIDIGSSVIKITELSKQGERIRLEAYGAIKAEAIYDKPFRTFEKSTLLFQTMDIARAVKGVIEEAKMASRKAVFSIPDFSTFYTTFDLPPMSLQEVPQAVRFQARQQIPVPLNEVSLDWLIIQGEMSDHQKTNIRILLVAVPNEIILQYQEIAKICKLELYALEAEVFGFLRSANLDASGGKTVVLIDIGAQSVTCSLADKGVLKQSRSFEPAGNEVTEVLSKALQIDFKAAESLQMKYGLLLAKEPGKENIGEVLSTIIDAILLEAERSFQNFVLERERDPELIILGGGLARLPGLKERFAQKFQKETEIISPFKNIFYPPILEKIIKEIGPSFAISVGAAMRGLE